MSRGIPPTLQGKKPHELNDRLINCGLCRVQKQKRISLKDILNKEGVNEGEFIEVFIKLEKKE